MEKQEDLKTLPKHHMSLAEQQWENEKQREAEVRTFCGIYQGEAEVRLGDGRGREEKTKKINYFKNVSLPNSIP